jgi:hypothetical protein
MLSSPLFFFLSSLIHIINKHCGIKMKRICEIMKMRLEYVKTSIMTLKGCEMPCHTPFI